MKVLWVNPSFLDYRIPVYYKLFNYFKGDFFLIYSRNRVPSRVISKIEDLLGENAIGLHNERIYEKGGKSDFANTEIRIPYQPGLYKAISEVKADLIIGEGFFQWTPLALSYAIIKRKKFVIAYERTAHTERNCPQWRTFYRQFVSKFVDGFSVNGQLTKEYLLQLGIKSEKIYLGGMSADSTGLVNKLKSHKQESLKENLELEKGLTYLYIGQINERKGVIHLLKAWTEHIEKYPGDNLLIVGTGPLYEKFRKQFSDYSSIQLLGGVDYDLIYRYYAITDVFIIPTLEDNWSLVVPEAMACSLPIACSIYNGCYPELVHENVNGKLFDPIEEQTIIETLSYFHGKDLKLMGDKSAEIEKKYNSDATAHKIYQSFMKICATN